MCPSMGPASAALFQYLLLVMMLEETIGKRFQQPPRESEMVEDNGADDDQDAALNCSFPQSPESVGVEAPCGPTHNNAQEDQRKHLSTVEFPGQSSSRASKRGKKRATAPETGERKKTTRCGKWTHHETTNLVNGRLQSLREKESVRRLGKNKSNEPVWEAISKHIPRRTGEQCQNRWDVVVRSYKTINSHLDGHGKQFSQLTEQDFRGMKVAPYFKSADWYHMFGEQREVWDSPHLRKGCQSSDMNGASTAITGMPALPSAGSLNPDAFPPVVVKSTSSPWDQIELAAVAAIELSVAVPKYEAGALDMDYLLVILRHKERHGRLKDATTSWSYSVTTPGAQKQKARLLKQNSVAATLTSLLSICN